MYQNRFIQEMARVLVSGGRFLIYVWAKEQTNKKSEMSSYLKQNKKNFKRSQENQQAEAVTKQTGEFGLPVHQNRTNFVHQVRKISILLKK